MFDADQGNPDDFVDILVVEQILSPSDSFTSPTAYTSEAGIFTIVISFRVECSESKQQVSQIPSINSLSFAIIIQTSMGSGATCSVNLPTIQTRDFTTATVRDRESVLADTRIQRLTALRLSLQEAQTSQSVMTVFVPTAPVRGRVCRP